MNDDAIRSNPPDSKKDIICHCSGTTQQHILRLIESGMNDLERISRMTGASAGCGACETEIQELLTKYLTK